VTFYKKIRQVVEVILTRFGLFVVPRLPRRVVLGLSIFLGQAAYFLSSHLRRVGRANLNIAFGHSVPEGRKREILRQSFQTAALVFLDVFWFARNTKKRVLDTITFDPIIGRLPGKIPRICVTAHLGNWEILGHAVTLRGFPLVSVVSPLANQLVDDLFMEMREVAGQQILPKQGVVKALLSTLRNGGNIGILLDQNTKPADGGIFVDFFHLPVPVSAAGASLALRTNAEIVFGFCLPQSNGMYRVSIPFRMTPRVRDGEDMKAAIQRLTQDIANVIESAIREQPGAWLWMYKRWKYVGPDRQRAEYPFYAKELKSRNGGVLK
jgi:Kdo2-lipid IVA lauroyltransferase/acyltransferase